MPANFFLNPAANLSLLLIIVGLAGTFVPVIPGPPLVWFGILAWAIGDRFQSMDWFTLGILAVIALVATFSEYWLTPITQKRAGFGWKNIIAAFVGGILGGIFLSGIPIIGTLFGAALGAVVGVMLVTFWERRQLGQAFEAGKTYLVGCFLSGLIEIAASLFMLAIFAWRAFFI